LSSDFWASQTADAGVEIVSRSAQSLSHSRIHFFSSGIVEIRTVGLTILERGEGSRPCWRDLRDDAEARPPVGDVEGLARAERSNKWKRSRRNWEMETPERILASMYMTSVHDDVV